MGDLQKAPHLLQQENAVFLFTVALKMTKCFISFEQHGPETLHVY